MCLKKSISVALIYICILASVPRTNAYPIFAQQTYKEPREANGRIVCANCHLAQKPVELDVPQAVLPASVFTAAISIPYDKQVSQVLRNGDLGGLNVGAVLILPDGFCLAPESRVPAERRDSGLYFQPYSATQENIIVVGPVSGAQYSEISMPILTPTPGTTKNVAFQKYSIYLGRNRGRGQVYPDGSKSNNTVYTSPAAGLVQGIVEKRRSSEIKIISPDGQVFTETVPRGPRVLVETGQNVRAEEPLTNNPNVGGFGQAESEIVLQDPARVYGLLGFFTVVFLTQVALVLKKKQFEKVQLAELNFSPCYFQS
jgi:apocytochrome f